MTIQMDDQELHDAFWEGGHGFCKACEEHIESGVDPDAHGDPCELCSEHAVFGLEELLLTEEIYIIHALDHVAERILADYDTERSATE